MLFETEMDEGFGGVSLGFRGRFWVRHGLLEREGALSLALAASVVHVNWVITIAGRGTMSRSKRMWVKPRELKSVRDLLRNRFGDGSNDKTVVPFDEILPLLVKPEPTRLVWTRAFRRFLRQELGVRCGLRESKQHFIFQIIDPEKWRRSLEGHTQIVPQQTLTTIALPERSDDPLIPEPDPDYLLPAFAETLLRGIQSGERTLLVGATGSGKSSLIRELAARTQSRFMRLNLSGETSVPDLLGTWKINRQREMVFQEGPVPRAMRLGAWLCLDEIDAALPQVLFCLQGLMEEGGRLYIPELNEWITPHEDFRIALTANTIGKGDESGLYAGTTSLNESFLDRIGAFHHVDYLPAHAEQRLLLKKIEGLGANVAERMIRVANDIRQAVKEGTVYCTFSTRRLLSWARKTIQMGDPMKAAQITVLNRLSDDDRRVVAEVLQRHGFGGGS
jgi:cobaltochelatase CobS